MGYKLGRKEYMRRYVLKNKEKFSSSYQSLRQKWRDEGTLQARDRAYNLKSSHGLSLEDYQTMLEKQLGKCATCLLPPDAKSKFVLHVDHNHATGKIRGLLCADCNLSLGKVKDEVDTLKRMIIYLNASG